MKTIKVTPITIPTYTKGRFAKEAAIRGIASKNVAKYYVNISGKDLFTEDDFIELFRYLENYIGSKGFVLDVDFADYAEDTILYDDFGNEVYI